MLIVTNNPKFNNLEYTNKYNVEFVDTDYLGILKNARDYIHKGYELLTHPLYGSVKPYETVYRTLILKEGKIISFTSLELIEEAIATASKFYAMNKNYKWTESILDDFQVVDKDLIDNTLARI
ncbi:GrdX family protein [Miniphocaeibacter halophilus]|uniref:GrdX family protein n=1 Tax=Miniphocaeibacter halophilus TaxID=2931922 RepID=A0AC61N161_9FIRM|nr:GrdX family protein [Miniphocaeibacter halophilus]QQK08688.1 GrdX family protein [Miniphocaeibacter halophilus]